MLRDNTQELEFVQRIDEPVLLRARVHSRFCGVKKHQTFMAYIDQLANAANDHEYVDGGNGPIVSYYCTCKAGEGTVGSCAHVASILWYSGYVCHQNNLKYPSTRFLETLDDAAQTHTHARADTHQQKKYKEIRVSIYSDFT